MPILVRGKTVCSLCGRVINEGEEVTMFSAFIPNELDPLLIFHDGAFHAGCFRLHPLSAEADRRCNESLERTGPGHRKCTVCDVEITDPDEYLGVGHLTDDPRDSLYRINYTHVHRSHLPSWPDREMLRRELERRVRDGRIKGLVYEHLLRELAA